MRVLQGVGNDGEVRGGIALGGGLGHLRPGHGLGNHLDADFLEVGGDQLAELPLFDRVRQVHEGHGDFLAGVLGLGQEFLGLGDVALERLDGGGIAGNDGRYRAGRGIGAAEDVLEAGIIVEGVGDGLADVDVVGGGQFGVHREVLQLGAGRRGHFHLGVLGHVGVRGNRQPLVDHVGLSGDQEGLDGGLLHDGLHPGLPDLAGLPALPIFVERGKIEVGLPVPVGEDVGTGSRAFRADVGLAVIAVLSEVSCLLVGLQQLAVDDEQLGERGNERGVGGLQLEYDGRVVGGINGCEDVAPQPCVAHVDGDHAFH